MNEILVKVNAETLGELDEVRKILEKSWQVICTGTSRNTQPPYPTGWRTYLALLEKEEDPR